ncbi:MAG TPA: FkbM family methyltransferase [Planktothrix sp.]
MDDFRYLQVDVQRADGMRRVSGPFAWSFIARTQQGVFAVPIEDLYVGHQLRFNGSYSTDELQRLRSICRPGTRLLCVGGHIGALVIPLAEVCSTVTAVEANPRIFEILQFNVQLNNLTNCRTIQIAASNSTEPLKFVLNRANSGGSKRYPIGWQEIYLHDNPEIVEVAAAPLDSVFPGEVFDVVVMDIEGSEYFALEGMPRILSEAQILQIEFVPHHLQFVAGVTVEQWLSPITAHFSSLFVPSKNLLVGRQQFFPTLDSMFAANEYDDSLMFSKSGVAESELRALVKT